MADMIYTTQTPSNDEFDGLTHHLGPLFSVSADRDVVGGRAWVPSTGRPATFFWQLWRVSDTTLLAEVDLNGLPAPSPSDWMSFTSADFSTPGDVPIVTTDTYIVNLYYGNSGNFNYLTPFTYPITNGVLTATEGRFNTGAAQATFPASTDTNAAFFADVTVDVDLVTGTLNLDLSPLLLELDGEVTASGVLDVDLSPLLLELDGEVTAAGVLNLDLSPLLLDLDGEVTASGFLDLDLSPLLLDLDGEVTASGVLNLDLSPLLLDLDGEVEGTVAGVLNLDLSPLLLALTGNSAAGGATVGPCGWTIPDPLCCDTWATTPAAVQSAARDYAATILWAATGRQFGLCEILVRPCGMKQCQDGLGEFWGYDWVGGTWIPYIFNGVWYNCACPGMCCCDPRCQVRLMGPVASIVEVTIGGVAVDPATYRVDDEHWLVRTAGECWPTCADLNTDDGDNVFEVTYTRGTAVPAALLRAASTLACEWAKACTGGDCRLSNRVTALARQGVSIELMDPNVLMENGWTGLWEVDTVLQAFNPYNTKQRLRIYAPELNVPRQPTWP